MLNFPTTSASLDLTDDTIRTPTRPPEAQQSNHAHRHRSLIARTFSHRIRAQPLRISMLTAPATPDTSRRHTPRCVIQRPINHRLTLLTIIERRPPDKQITHRRYQQPLRTQHLAQ
jgi:hypothetical protein